MIIIIIMIRRGCLLTIITIKQSAVINLIMDNSRKDLHKDFDSNSYGFKFYLLFFFSENCLLIT